MAATLRTVGTAGAHRFCTTSSALRVAQPANVGSSTSPLLGTGRPLSFRWGCPPTAILKRRKVYGLRALSTGEFGTREDGQPETLEYRLFFADKSGKTILPRHDIPLTAGDGSYNFIVEIPKESSAKFEVATDEPNTPIKQDTKKGKLRFYLDNINWNYGLLPQTWEGPSQANPEVDGAFGYNDPGCSDGEDLPSQSGHFHESGSESLSFQRREMMGKAATLMMSLISLPALGAEEDFKLYLDEEEKFSLLVPQEWTKGEGNAGTRKVTAFFPETDSSANGLGADYTGLGSFGTVDIFAENLVNSLDRAWQRPKGQAAKLIDARSRNGMYYVEYTIQKPGEAKRHLLSVVGIASNGWINRLYTVTGQYWEDDGDKYKASLEKAITSFRLV